MKPSQRIGLFLAVFAALLALAGAIAAAHFDADWAKRRLAALVMENKQRTLRIDGELAIGLWPNIEVRIGPASLSEHGGTQTFARLEAARFSLQWLPLLSRRMVIDNLEVSGLHADVVRDRSGRLNIADLLASSEPGMVQVDLGALHLAQAQLAWRDEQAAREVALDEVDLRCGRIADVAQGQLTLAGRLRASGTPPADAQLKLAAAYALDRAQQRYVLTRLHGSLIGSDGLNLALDAASISAEPAQIGVTGLALHAARRQASDAFDLQLGAAQLQFAAGKLSGGPLTLALDARSGATVVQATLTAPLAADLTAQTLALPELRGDVAIAHPRLVQLPLKLPLHGRLAADLAQHTTAGELAGQLDVSRLSARFTLQQLATPALDFVIDIDRLDLDRYLRPAPTTRAGADSPPAAAPPTLKLRGTLNIGALQFAGVKARQLHLAVSAADGRLVVTTRPPR